MIKENSEMSPRMAEIFKKFRPGIDFLIMSPNEPVQGMDKYDEPDGKIRYLEYDFDKLAKNHRDFVSDYNSGVYAAFDPSSKIFIYTARPDVISVRYGDGDRGLWVPLRLDMGDLPVGSEKVAAFEYQKTVAEMLKAEKIACKLNEGLRNALKATAMSR